MTIEEKINALPSEARKEIFDFIEFLVEKNRKEDKEWHLKLSKKSLDKIWNNTEDDLTKGITVMQTTFNDLVDNVRNLSLPEKIEIKTILEKSIIEEERDKIHASFLENKKEQEENKLKFSSNINELRKMID